MLNRKSFKYVSKIIYWSALLLELTFVPRRIFIELRVKEWSFILPYIIRLRQTDNNLMSNQLAKQSLSVLRLLLFSCVLAYDSHIVDLLIGINGVRYVLVLCCHQNNNKRIAITHKVKCCSTHTHKYNWSKRSIWQASKQAINHGVINFPKLSTYLIYHSS